MQLLDAEALCAFARFCDPNGQVWNQVDQTQSPGVRATFIRQVGNCAAWLREINRPKRMLSRICRSQLVSWRIQRKPAMALFGCAGASRSPPRTAFNTKYATA
jgi:hypothetical protein